jgi:hypothetical protein
VAPLTRERLCSVLTYAQEDADRDKGASAVSCSGSLRNLLLRLSGYVRANCAKGAFPPSHFCNKLDDKLSLTKSPYKQMSHIFVLFVSQKFVANQIGLLQTH